MTSFNNKRVNFKKTDKKTKKTSYKQKEFKLENDTKKDYKKTPTKRFTESSVNSKSWNKLNIKLEQERKIPMTVDTNVKYDVYVDGQKLGTFKSGEYEFDVSKSKFQKHKISIVKAGEDKSKGDNYEYMFGSENGLEEASLSIGLMDFITRPVLEAVENLGDGVVTLGGGLVSGIASLFSEEAAESIDQGVKDWVTADSTGDLLNQSALKKYTKPMSKAIQRPIEGVEIAVGGPVGFALVGVQEAGSETVKHNGEFNDEAAIDAFGGTITSYFYSELYAAGAEVALNNGKGSIGDIVSTSAKKVYNLRTAEGRYQFEQGFKETLANPYSWRNAVGLEAYSFIKYANNSYKAGSLSWENFEKIVNKIWINKGVISTFGGLGSVEVSGDVTVKSIVGEEGSALYEEFEIEQKIAKKHPEVENMSMEEILDKYPDEVIKYDKSISEKEVIGNTKQFKNRKELATYEARRKYIRKNVNDELNNLSQGKQKELIKTEINQIKQLTYDKYEKVKEKIGYLIAQNSLDTATEGYAE